MFYVGQKVVCVDDEFIDPSWEFVPYKPTKNKVYTVLKYALERFDTCTDFALWLVELPNPHVDWVNGFREIGFWSARFRPLVEKKTSIELFQKMLLPNNLETV